MMLLITAVRLFTFIWSQRQCYTHSQQNTLFYTNTTVHPSSMKQVSVDNNISRVIHFCVATCTTSKCQQSPEILHNFVSNQLKFCCLYLRIIFTLHKVIKLTFMLTTWGFDQYMLDSAGVLSGDKAVYYTYIKSLRRQYVFAFDKWIDSVEAQCDHSACLTMLQ